jgi:hypothetical protein
MVRGQLVQRIRHQGDLVGFHLQYQIDEFFLAAVAFDIEFRMDDRPERPDISIADMPLVRPGMDRDAVSAKCLDVHRGLPDIRVIAAPGIAQRGDLVDIDGEPGHGSKVGFYLQAWPVKDA